MKLGRMVGVLPLLLAACGNVPDAVSGGPATGGPSDVPSADDVTSVVVALTAVPSTVHCIQVVAAGSSTTTSRLDVTPAASSATLSLGRLPLGDTQFRGSAFDNACSAISNTQPSWVADPVTVSLRAGVSSTVTLTFRTNSVVTATANFVQSAAAIASAKGSFETYMIVADGTVRASGGIFGTTAFGSNTVTTPITDALELAAGQQFYCFIKKADGSVWCAGVNRFGECGPNAPINDTARITTPVQVPFPAGSGRASHIAAGLNHACATVGMVGASTQLESIFCWGLNNAGQLGTTTAAAAPNATPVQVPAVFTSNIPRVGGTQLAAGYNHTCVNVFTGVSCWGFNGSGQVGDGTNTNAFRYADVPNTGGTVGIALGALHTCALGGDGTVNCWGDNSVGQIGDGTSDPRLSPSAVPSVAGIADATQITGGTGANCVVRAGGKVSCWGINNRGELGDGTTDNRSTPVDVRGLASNVLTLVTGTEVTFAIMNDRTVFAWGDNTQGALGDGTRTTRFAPVPVLTQ